MSKVIKKIIFVIIGFCFYLSVNAQTKVGGVGINTENPIADLDVNGTVLITGFEGLENMPDAKLFLTKDQEGIVTLNNQVGGNGALLYGPYFLRLDSDLMNTTGFIVPWSTSPPTTPGQANFKPNGDIMFNTGVISPVFLDESKTNFYEININITARYSIEATASVQVLNAISTAFRGLIQVKRDGSTVWENLTSGETYIFGSANTSSDSKNYNIIMPKVIVELNKGDKLRAVLIRPEGRGALHSDSILKSPFLTPIGQSFILKLIIV